MTKLTPLSRAVAQATAVSGACLLAFACPAAAFTPSTKTGGENTPLSLNASSTGATHTSATGGASIVRTVVGLAIVLAVIWGLTWILRQVKAGRDGGRDGHQSSVGLSSVATLTLGGGRSVHLIRAGSDYLLLASAEHGLAPIHRYSEEQAREAGLPLFEDIAPARPRRSLLASSLIRPAQDGRAVTRYSSPLGDDASPVRRDATGRIERADPMRMSSPSSNIVERMREWTVRG